MRTTLTLVSLLAVSTLWPAGGAPAEDPSTTGKANMVNASGAEGIAAPARTPEAGRSGLDQGRPSPAEAPASSLPPCAHAGPPVSIPSEFPKNFPLPPGTVITASRRADAAVVLEGFIPMELPKATRFFLQNLTAAGFRLGRGEAERGEAEDGFTGNGLVGFFKVRSIEGCPGTLQFTIQVSEYKPPGSAQPH